MADKAFLTGINQYKTIGDLRGCVNDTRSLKRLLTESLGFEPENVRVKKDSEVTKAAMNQGWKWLLKDAKPGDRLVFHFSGHGSQIADVDGDEDDGADELLCLHAMDWNDPKTYLLDDEINEWTKQIPAGVAVTFLLDCCHSGTGTRMIEPIMSRAAKTDFRSASLLSLDDVALARESASRGDAVAAVRSTENPGVCPAREESINEATVLARYAPPPVEVQVQIDKAKRRTTMRDAFATAPTRRGDDAMNHVLWSGCKDDQTSADAHINGDFHGAFTYYFCESVRAQEATPKTPAVIDQLRQTLASNRFSQIPQLEPAHTRGEVFRENLGGSPSDSPSDSASDSSSGGASGETPSSPIAPTASEWQSLLQSLQQLVNLLGGGRADTTTSRAGGHSLLYVHGICPHDPGYSDRWWSALQPRLPEPVKSNLAANRHEVLWSEHVTRVSRSTEMDATAEDRRRLEMFIEAALQERAVKEAEEQLATTSEGEEVEGTRSLENSEPVPRAMLGIPGLNCVDDFVKYLTIDSIRRAVIEEFTRKARPLLQRGDSIEIISHSWGTVVAYEALRSLDRLGLPGRVHNWFTVGAALAISLIARQLRPQGGQKPALVERWVNLNARGDMVGGSLRATGMQVDHEYLRLPPTGCAVRLGLVAPACAHSSYFDHGNVQVNRDIFAHWITRP